MISSLPISSIHAEPAALDSRFDLDQAAEWAAARLRCDARKSGDTVTWLGLENDSADLPSGLFSGVAGVSLVLAIRGRAAGCRPCARLAEEALQEPRRRLRERLEEPAPLPLDGASFGVGSWIYTLAKISMLTEDPGPAEDALALAAHITPERIAEVQTCGLSDGVAGLLLVLLAVREAAFERGLKTELDDSIIACAEKLRGFLDADCPSGLAHGLSGIAYALTRLYEQDPAGDWHWDAHVALAKERRLFDAQNRVWRSPRNEHPLDESGWREGPAGMLLARAAMVARDVYPDDPTSQADLHIVLEETRNRAARREDSLSSGNLGRALILQQAGLQLGQSELVVEARQIGRSVASRCPGELFLRSSIAEDQSPVLEPGLMNGLAGICYALMRLSRPELPCLLLLE